MATGSRIFGDLLIDGVTTFKDDIVLGLATTSGTSRDIILEGIEPNISLNIEVKGTGTIQVPVSYEDNIASGQDLVNRGYTDIHIAGLNTAITDPGGDRLLFWDDSESVIDWLQPDSTFSISATTLSVAANSSVQKVAVRKNSTGGDVGTRRRLNFIEGSGITLTITDDAGADDEIDVTIASSAGGGGTVTGVSSGNFSPLFNVSVSESSPAPAFSYTAINQNANIIYAGPASGAAAAPSFRAIVADDIANNLISNAKIRDSAALSVIGNPTNATADPQDMAAGTDGHILRRSGTSVGFGTIVISSMTMNTDRILGRTTASSGAVEEMQVLNGLTLASNVLRGGGALNQNTTITGASGTYSYSLTGLSSFEATANSGGSLYSNAAQAGASFGDSFFQVGDNLVLISADSSARSITVGTNGISFGIPSRATGDLWYNDGSNYVTRLGIGSTGQVLTVSGGLPVWSTPTASLSRSQSGTNYTVQESDNGYTVYFTSATGVTVNLPDTLPNNFEFVAVRENGAGTVTFSPSSTTLNTIGSETTIDYANGHVSWQYKQDTDDWYGSGALGTIGSGGGTVTEVRLADITSFATATGSPVNGDGELGYTLNSQIANTIFAGPVTGSSTTPSFRAMVMLDVPRPAKDVPDAAYTIGVDDLGYNIYFTNSSGCDVTLDDTITTVPNFWCVAIRDSAMTSGNLEFITSSATFNTINGETEVTFVNGSVALEQKEAGVWYGWGALGSGSGGGGSAHVIESHGVALSPQRSNLNITNGLYAADNNPDSDIKLGGALTESTTITGASGTYSFDITGLLSFSVLQNLGHGLSNNNTYTRLRDTAGTSYIETTSAGVLSLENSSGRRVRVSSTAIELDLTSDATGDMYYRDGSGNLTRLAVGAATTVIGGNGTSPVNKTVSNGLTADATTFKLGGALTANTSLTGNFSLGIGVSPPTHKLHVMSHAAQNNYFAVKDSTDAYAVDVRNDRAYFQVGTAVVGIGTVSSIMSYGSSVVTLNGSSLDINTASTGVRFSHTSTTTTGFNVTNESTGDSIVAIKVGSTGDPAIAFHTNTGGAQVWRMGMDNSDSDAFILNQGTGALGANTILKIATGGISNDDAQTNVLAYNTTTKQLYYRTVSSIGGGGAVDSVELTQPAAGLTITNTGVPQTGATDFTFALANDLAALEGLGSTGIAVRSAANTWVQRQVASGNSLIGVTNPDGIAGDITLTFAHLGFQSLTSPGADRILFYDQSATSFQWLQYESRITNGAGTTLTLDIGTGTAGQVTYWDSGNKFTGEAAFAYNATTNILSVDGIELGVAATTGTTRTIGAVGTESNIDIVLNTKGQGDIVFTEAGVEFVRFNLTGVGSSLVLGGSSAGGSSRSIRAEGSSSNVAISISSKGTGSAELRTASSNAIFLATNGAVQVNATTTIEIGDASSAADINIMTASGDITIDAGSGDINMVVTPSVDVVVASTHTAVINFDGTPYKVLLATP